MKTSLALLGAAAASAANTYTGASSGNWFESTSSWSDGSFPTYPETVSIGKDVLLNKPTNGAGRMIKISGSLTVVGTMLEVSPSSCDPTQFEESAPTATADRVCKDTVVCGAVGTQWEQSERTATDHRVCIDVEACDEGEYETDAPTATSPRICASHTPCPRDQYETTPPAWNSDRKCTALRQCGAKEFMTAKPVDDGEQFTANRECQAHDDCNTVTHTETVAAIGGNDGSRNQKCEAKVHCEMHGWGAWSTCTKSCNTGTQSRSRGIKVGMQYAGTPCLSKGHGTHNEETATCATSCCKGFVQQDNIGNKADNAHTVQAKRITPVLTVEVVAFVGAAKGTAAEVCGAREGFRACTDHEALYLVPKVNGAAHVHCCGQRSGPSCAPCQNGGFSNWLGMGACPSCPAGSWSAGGSVACTQCDAGTESPNTGAPSITHCTDCNKGHFSGKGASACTACAAGTENSAKGSASIGACTPCAKGFANPDKGQAECAVCQSGEYSDDFGSETCAKCVAGKRQPALGAKAEGFCLSCGFGEWSEERSATCVSCEAGTASAQSGADEKSDCETCTPGHWAGEKAKTCTQCAKGQFTAAHGSKVCGDCPAGTFLSSLGGNKLGDCQPCPLGHYCPQGAVKAIACDGGYELNSMRATKDSDCLKCNLGWHAPTAGTAQCTKCGIGTYQDTKGQKACKTCDAGHAQPLEARTAKSDCEYCNAGKYQPHDHRSFCVGCGTGFYQNVPGQTSCEKCPSGSYGKPAGDKTTRNGGCEQCEAGRYQPDEATSGCIKCGLGKKSNFKGAKTLTVCTHCEWGSYADELGQATCKNCAKGHFGDVTKTKGMIAHCIHCPHGEYQQYDGSTKCETCGAGSFTGTANCNADNSKCTFAPSTGNHQCTTCPRVDAIRTWTSDSGAKACFKKQAPCEMGEWSVWGNPAGHAAGAPRTGTCGKTCTDEGGYDAGTYIGATAPGRQSRTRSSIMRMPCGLTDQSKCDWSWGFAGDVDDVKQCKSTWEDQTCNEHFCARKCTVTPWEPWSTCTRACGGGATSRSRTIAHQAAHGGSCNDHFDENAGCNEITCEWPKCHDKHVKCAVVSKTFTGCGAVHTCGADVQSPNKCHLWSDYDIAKGQQSCHKCSSIAECAIEGVHKTIVVQHVRDHMCPGCTRVQNGVDAVYEQSEGPASALRNMFNCSFSKNAVDQCSCRCKMHPPCAGKAGFELTNQLVFGNHWYNIADRQTCCNMCTNHADCDAFSFTADGQCKLYQGSAVYKAGAADTFSGCRSGDAC
jgi:hypothetical protein